MSEQVRVHVAVLTTGRQDYGILRSTLQLMVAAPDMQLSVWAGGMHLSELHGRAIDVIREDGIPVAREIDFMEAVSDALGDSGRVVAAVGKAIVEVRPDALMLVGDRSETLAAGVAATIAATPIIHLHGGEESEGAIDNACRHALTKLSHLHLVTHPVHARRVMQMGEAPHTVCIVGAPGVDNLYRDDLPTRADLEDHLGIVLKGPVLLVTLHPTTLGADSLSEVSALADALARISGTIVVTQPNSDEGATVIREFWKRWSSGRSNVVIVDMLGASRYWALLRMAAVVAGNSSSGIIEASSAGVPVVNIGDRQKGRVRVGMIIDTEVDADAIESALRRALADNDISTTKSDVEPYPAGPAAPRIIAAIRQWSTNATPRKRFHDLDCNFPTTALKGRK